MRSIWSDIAAHERETEALAERLELRIHAIAMVVTAIVLAMRLVAGTRDFETETWSEGAAGEEVVSEGATAPHAYGL